MSDLDFASDEDEVTTEEAAKILGKTPQTLRTWLYLGKIHGRRIKGNRYVFTIAEIRRLLNED